MIGRKLSERLAKDGELNGKPIEKMTLTDVVAPRAAGILRQGRGARRRPAGAGRRRKADRRRPDVIFHLAGDRLRRSRARFRQGLSRQPRKHPASPGSDPQDRRRLSSEVRVHVLDRGVRRAVPARDPDEFHLTPLTSYGAQKAMGELLLADYVRKGFLDGVGIRLPTICVRPGKPNKAASGFFSNIIREPLAGRRRCLPVKESVRSHPCEPARGGRLPHPWRRADARAAWAAHQSRDAGRLLHGR